MALQKCVWNTDVEPNFRAVLAVKRIELTAVSFHQVLFLDLLAQLFEHVVLVLHVVQLTEGTTKLAPTAKRGLFKPGV